MAPRFARRFNEPFPLPDLWSSYQRLRDYSRHFRSVLKICQTLNNGVFIEKKTKTEDMLGLPESGNFLIWLSVESRWTKGRAAFRTGTVSTPFFRKIFEKILTLWFRRIFFFDSAMQVMQFD